MTSTIPRALQARVLDVLIDCLAIEIRKPRLDVSRRDEDRDAFLRLTTSITCFPARALKLIDSHGDFAAISINDDDQSLLDLVFA